MDAVQLRERLAASANSDGGWGYCDQCASMAEPTALAALALSLAGTRERVGPALDWLAAHQQACGAVALCGGLPDALWPTPAALLAWKLCDAVRFAGNVERAGAWLLVHGGRTSERTAEVSHDPRIPGWSWLSETSPWVEPTAMSILALRAVGHGGHARVLDGLRLLRDRALPGGGWNYGNTVVLQHELRAFPDTTGLALLALAGTPSGREINRGVQYLKTRLADIRAGVSLGWGALALHAWKCGPAQLRDWLSAAIESAGQRVSHAHADALLLIADFVTANRTANPFGNSAPDDAAQMVAA